MKNQLWLSFSYTPHSANKKPALFTLIITDESDIIMTKENYQCLEHKEKKLLNPIVPNHRKQSENIPIPSSNFLWELK